ncbi:hypothetical protein LBMAG56_22360 [Verrucomicrobiota bacterium]|nr:hypothetical protein LBMAG56_22360 [Verrucomicrobiota bacterium]
MSWRKASPWRGARRIKIAEESGEMKKRQRPRTAGVPACEFRRRLAARDRGLEFRVYAARRLRTA